MTPTEEPRFPLPDGRLLKGVLVSPPSDYLLVVALKTDQPNIERRVRAILAAAEPIATDTEAVVWAKPVDELVAADLDALVALTNVGPDAVARLREAECNGPRDCIGTDRGCRHCGVSEETL